jgi:hypothetical protein
MQGIEGLAAWQIEGDKGNDITTARQPQGHEVKYALGAAPEGGHALYNKQKLQAGDLERLLV